MTRTYRRYKVEDAEPTYAVFYRAIREGTADYYSEEQRSAWAASEEMRPGWPERLAQTACWVAEDDGEVIGFFTLEQDGHIDLVFVLPEYHGTDVAGALYDLILVDAHALGLQRLFTEASRMAQPFFAKRGWHITSRETIVREGVELDRYNMARDLF
ncbi:MULTISPECIES: GNAT family N-acetyltransferase [Halocynthiibacter]|uniref:GNAT family N-acetyltransferase n=1 Tax=Halocynthiibacter halioticoli TaxID=2986804 RepID=A0AAE3LUL8_9RHOB|nr:MULTISPECIES: GNAT family N-acetyltransferase [Halocynthiibacter]MCV6824730.1 GNAT family N-acetyltransferase [Halocynthiibacter halioticoli]MCW4057731.1 GNAT family N-acetyltransferase [Halocynthiibacter sp. SDUM655004]MDE0589229.1 GNAT family N-acetyltransferase [Halocynthiibacter sp. C4]